MNGWTNKTKRIRPRRRTTLGTRVAKTEHLVFDSGVSREAERPKVRDDLFSPEETIVSLRKIQNCLFQSGEALPKYLPLKICDLPKSRAERKNDVHGLCSNATTSSITILTFHSTERFGNASVLCNLILSNDELASLTIRFTKRISIGEYHQNCASLVVDWTATT